MTFFDTNHGLIEAPALREGVAYVTQAPSRLIVLPTEREVLATLTVDPVAARIMSKGLKPRCGDLVGVRLNLNIMKRCQIPIQTLHKGNASGNHMRNKGFFNGTPIWYQMAVTLLDAYFNGVCGISC
jgi:hypothetical protein